MLLDKHQNKRLSVDTAKEKIDAIDRQIISLISQRYKYMAIMQKQNLDIANSDKDFKTILEQRKSWSLSAGLHPNLVNKISQYLIDYYITEVSR